MNLFLTSNLDLWYNPQPFYEHLVQDIPITNPAKVPVKNGLYGVRSMTLKKLSHPWNFKALDTWLELDGYGRTFYWHYYGYNEAYSTTIAEGEYTRTELADAITAGFTIEDPNALLRIIWDHASYPDKFSIWYEDPNSRALVFEWDRMPIFARRLGFPLTPMRWFNDVTTVNPMDPQDDVGVKRVYLRIKKINSEDFQLINIQDNDDVFAVWDVQVNGQGMVVYVPPVEHTIYFDQSETHNHFEVSFMANFGGSLTAIPFHGIDWSIDMIYETINSKKSLALKQEFY